METTSPLFLLLVLFFSVSGVCATVENSEDDFEENNHRVDAEQEPFSKVTLAPKSGDPTSTLFRSCLDSSRTTFDAKFTSIETPGGITYTRYVPDSSMLAFPVTWENAEGSVSDIFECTTVAEAAGYSMFKYSANGCQLSIQGYDLEKVPAYEDNEADAVFIKPFVEGSCTLPSVAVGSGGVCFIFTDNLMTRDAAESFCDSYDMHLYFNFYDAAVLTFEEVIVKIPDLGYTTNLWTGAAYNDGAFGFPGWRFGVPPEAWVGGAEPTDGTKVAYLDWKAGWKLRGAQKSDLAGAVCFIRSL